MVGASRFHGTCYREPFGRAVRLVGPRLMSRLAHVQFVVGVDPVFAGIHLYANIADGRSFRETAHCCYPFHIVGPADRRVTTIVLPERPTTHTIVHELGHALHETIGFDHDAEAVTDYARTNRWEAFAEAFTSWVWPWPGVYARPDDATLSLFEELEG